MVCHRIGYATACAFAAACVGSAAIADAPALTKLEARKLPPRPLAKRVTDQLSDVLLARPPVKREGRPKRPLADLWFWTRYHPSGVRKLCVSDQIVFSFASDPGEMRDATGATRVVGLSVSHHYRFLAPPRSVEPVWSSNDEQDDDRAACAALDPVEDGSAIQADGPGVAYEGLWAFLQFVGDVRSQSYSGTLACADPPPNSPAKSCATVISAMQSWNINSIKDCSEGNADSRFDSCWIYGFGGDEDLLLQGKGGGISKATQRTYVTVADSRQD